MQTEPTRSLSDMHANPRNPRTISKQRFDALKTSITRFGDLSGIVRNRTTNRLVGGHQRVEAFKALHAPGVVIEDQFEKPNSVGTVARGYVMLGDEKYTYREVEWPADFEEAANIAANNITGEFDRDALAEIMYELDDELRELTGHTDDEIDKLLTQVAGEDEPPEEPKVGYEELAFTFTTAQADTIRRAIESAKTKEQFAGQENQNSDGNAVYFVACHYLEIMPAAGAPMAAPAEPGIEPPQG